MKKELIVLVNENGRRTGVAEKMLVHRNGWLHRAFSVFIFNGKNEMLLQRRSAAKYHFAGLWSNACCSHPHPNEKILAAANRRLKEELNLHCELKIVGHVRYNLYDASSGLREHEYDYLLEGKTEQQEMRFNRFEVADAKWMALSEIQKALREKPEQFTPWFGLVMDQISWQ